MFAGAIAVIYNTPDVGRLTLSRALVNAIFVGATTSWCAPRPPGPLPVRVACCPFRVSPVRVALVNAVFVGAATSWCAPRPEHPSESLPSESPFGAAGRAPGRPPVAPPFGAARLRRPSEPPRPILPPHSIGNWAIPAKSVVMDPATATLGEQRSHRTL